MPYASLLLLAWASGHKELPMSDNYGSAAKAGAVVARDAERFKLLFKNGRPEIPAGYTAPLVVKLTRAVIGERSRSAAA